MRSAYSSSLDKD